MVSSIAGWCARRVGQAVAALALSVVLLSAIAAGAHAAQDDMLLVSRASGITGANANNASMASAISADGRFVAFQSTATNLDPADTDGSHDIFLRDLQTSTTTLVSRDSGILGVKGNSHSIDPAISADGRYVAFASRASNLAGNGDSYFDIFVRDLQTSVTTLISRASGLDGAKGNHESLEPAISADGRFVGFYSNATTLHPDDTDGLSDVFVRDTLSYTTTLVSRAGGAAGAKGNALSVEPAISADGQLVAFSSFATNLHPDDPTDSQRDVFLRDLHNDTTILVSRAPRPLGANANDHAWKPTISPEGRYVAFNSLASNLSPFVTSSAYQVYRRDLQDHVTILVSRAPGPFGVPGNSRSDEPAISANGDYVVFFSVASNLHPDDTDQIGDIFTRELHTPTNHNRLASRASGASGVKGNDHSSSPTISNDGRFVALTSSATNLDPADTDIYPDVFVRDVLGPPGSSR